MLFLWRGYFIYPPHINCLEIDFRGKLYQKILKVQTKRTIFIEIELNQEIFYK